MVLEVCLKGSEDWQPIEVLGKRRGFIRAQFEDGKCKHLFCLIFIYEACSLSQHCSHESLLEYFLISVGLYAISQAVDVTNLYWCMTQFKISYFFPMELISWKHWNF